jgi:hypothetical protein
MTCTPTALLKAATCYDGIPEGMRQPVIIYLLASMMNSATGASMDPTALTAAAKCYVGIPPEMQVAIQTYLLCQAANSSGA